MKLSILTGRVLALGGLLGSSIPLVAVSRSSMQAPPAPKELSPSQVFEKVKASVVVVKSLNAKGEATMLGSGVKLPSGRIITNFHVVKDGVRFIVGQGDHFVQATIYAADAEKDLCLLDAAELKTPSSILGSTSTLKVGESVYAIGSPRGLELSLSNGIVSQLRGAPPPIIQTTAAISHGSSGGGLFDSRGHLVGIVAFYMEGGQSLNFALPVEWIEQLQPDLPLVVVTRSTGEWVAQTLKLDQEQRWNELLSWTRAWVEASRGSAMAWYCLGDAYVYLKRLNDAIEPYRQSLRINPESSSTWYNLGHTYHNLNRHAEAVEAYRQALRIDPRDASAWNNLGNSYGKLGRLTDAMNAYREALNIAPEKDAAWYNLGNTFFDLGRPTDALKAYQQSLRINPKDANAWYGLGNTFRKLNRQGDAIKAYRQALEINPESIYAWNNLVLSYVLSDNIEAALEAVQHLKKLDPLRANQLLKVLSPD